MDLNYEMPKLHPMLKSKYDYHVVIEKGNEELKARKREILELRESKASLEEQLYPTITEQTTEGTK